MLAETVGYLQVDPFSHRHVLDTMPKQSFDPNQVIPCSGLVCVIERGSVLIRHARDKYPIKELYQGAVFGEMPSIGQTMLAAEAIAGTRRVTLTIMNDEQAAQWIAADPFWFVGVIGPRLVERQADLNRIEFQPPVSRVAALLLKMGGNGTVIKELTHETIGRMIGLGREMVTVKLQEMESFGLVEAGYRKITILDEDTLRRLSTDGCYLGTPPSTESSCAEPAQAVTTKQPAPVRLTPVCSGFKQSSAAIGEPKENKEHTTDKTGPGFQSGQGQKPARRAVGDRGRRSLSRTGEGHHLQATEGSKKGRLH